MMRNILVSILMIIFSSYLIAAEDLKGMLKQLNSKDAALSKKAESKIISWAKKDHVKQRNQLLVQSHNQSTSKLLRSKLKNILRQTVNLSTSTLGLLSSTQRGHLGVTVREVYPNSPADVAGLRMGDNIVQINNNSIWDVQHFIKYQPVDTVLTISIRRNPMVEKTETFTLRTIPRDEYFKQINIKDPLLNEDGLQEQKQSDAEKVFVNWKKIHLNTLPSQEAVALTTKLNSKEYAQREQATTDLIAWVNQQDKSQRIDELVTLYNKDSSIEVRSRLIHIFEQTLDFSRGMLGISMAIDEANRGIKVDQVYPGTSAEQAGLKAGDIILKIDGKSPFTIQEYLGSLRAGTKAEFHILRGEEQLTKICTLMSREEFYKKTQKDNSYTLRQLLREKEAQRYNWKKTHLDDVN